jgi:hypothetical protein
MPVLSDTPSLRGGGPAGVAELSRSSREAFRVGSC